MRRPATQGGIHDSCKGHRNLRDISGEFRRRDSRRCGTCKQDVTQCPKRMSKGAAGHREGRRRGRVPRQPDGDIRPGGGGVSITQDRPRDPHATTEDCAMTARPLSPRLRTRIDQLHPAAERRAAVPFGRAYADRGAGPDRVTRSRPGDRRQRIGDSRSHVMSAPARRRSTWRQARRPRALGRDP